MSNTRTDRLELVTSLAGQLVEIVSAQPTHSVPLQALINAYIAVAMCHPCCAQQAAAAARAAADAIEASAAPAGAPHVH